MLRSDEYSHQFEKKLQRKFPLKALSSSQKGLGRKNTTIFNLLRMGYLTLNSDSIVCLIFKDLAFRVQT